MRIVAGLFALASIVVGASSVLPPDFRQARQLYFQGADGDKKAYDESDKLFSDLYQQHGNVPQIEVYYGSLRLLEAEHTWALWRKNSLSKEGIQLMDAAVGAAPGDLEVRFVRASTTYRLPGFFHRKEQSQKDFEYLAKRASESARNGALEPRLAAASLYYHGEFLKDSGQTTAAATVWEKAIALAPQSRAARESRAALDKTASSGS